MPATIQSRDPVGGFEHLPDLNLAASSYGAAKVPQVRPRVAMLVFNTCENDSRVIREAEALVQSGYDVTVVARRAPGIPIKEVRNGVTYSRVLNVVDRWVPAQRRFARLMGYLRSDPYPDWPRRLLGKILGLFWPNFTNSSRSGAERAERRKSRSASAGSLPNSGRRSGSALRRFYRAVHVARSRFAATSKRSAPHHSDRPRRLAGKVLGLSWPKFADLSRSDAERVKPGVKPSLASAGSSPNSGRRSRSALRRLYRAVRVACCKVAATSRSAIHAIARWINGKMRRLTLFANNVAAKSRSASRALTRRINGKKRSMTLFANKLLVHAPARWINGKKRSLILFANKLIGTAFIFEVADIGMRRRLLSLKPDIIHAHDLTTLPTAARAAEDLGARLVYDSHELEMHRNASYSRYTWRRRGRAERKGIKAADLVITVSDSIADHLRDEYEIARPSVVLNSPSLDAPQLASSHTVRSHLGLPDKTPLAIYVGSVTINRGIEMCVRALKHYPELHFATIGPRRKLTEIELAETARTEGVEDRFHMIDPVPSDAVVTFVASADVSVLPIQNACLSYYYCMPNKLFESVLGGLPVAVADLVELRKFVERYGCGLVMDETDPEDIARKIRDIIGSRKRYLLNGARRAEIRKTYAWPAQANRLVEAYAGLVKHRPANEHLSLN